MPRPERGGLGTAASWWRKGVVEWVAGLVAGLALAAPCRAQIRVLQTDAPLGSFELGPLRLRPTLAIDNLGVDNNVFNSGTRLRDNTLVMSPGLDSFLPIGRRLRLYGNGQLDVAYFAREADQRYVDAQSVGDLELDIGPTTLFAGAGAGSRRRRFTIEIDSRVRRDVRHAEAGIQIRIGPRTRLGFQASTLSEDYDENSAANGEQIKIALDRDNYRGDVELRYHLTHKTTLIASARGEQDEFISDASPQNRARSYRYLTGFEFSSNAVVGGRLLAGARIYPGRENQAVPTYSGLALEAHLNRELTWFAWGELRVARDVSYSIDRGKTRDLEQRNTYVYARYGAQLAFMLPRDLLLRTVVGFERSVYQLPVEQSGDLIDRVDRRWTLRGALLWPVGDHVSIGGAVTWARRRSNLDGVAYEGLNYGLTAEFRP